jgi:hypothetical protein
VKPAVFLNLMFNRAPERIARALLRRADVDFISREPALSALRDAGVSCRALDDFFTPGDQDLLVPELVWRLQAFGATLDSPAFRASFPWMDDDTFSAARARLESVGRTHLPVGMCESVMFRRCAESVNLKLAVFSEDHLTHTRAYVHQARALGIPTMVVAHAIPLGCPSPMPNVDADRVACFGPLTADRYRLVGAREDQIAVTGNPAWDPCAGPPPPGMRGEIRAGLGIGPDEKVAVYATTGAGRWSTSLCRVPAIHTDHAAAAAEAFVTLARRHPEWHFGLRPRLDDQDISFAVSLAGTIRDAGGRAFLDRLHPYSSVVNADVVVASDSNFLVEALLLDRRAVNLRLPGAHALPFTEGLGPLFGPEDAVPTVSGPGEMANAVESMMLGGPAAERFQRLRRETIARFNHPNDGKATERVADLALELMGLDPAARRPLDTRDALSDAANREGEERFVAGDLPGALAAFTRAVQARRDNPDLLSNLATALHAAGAPEKAWDLLVEALHRDPRHESARDNLRALAVALGRHTAADALLDAYPG